MLSSDHETSQNVGKPDISVTELGAWLISVHSVNVEDSSFGAKIRLVFKFFSDNINTDHRFKRAGSRTYFRPSETDNWLPGQATEILNRLSGGISQTLFYGEKSEIGFLFHEEGSPANQFVLEMVYEGHFKHVFELQKFPYEIDVLSIDLVFWCANEVDLQRTWQVSDTKYTSPGGDRLDLPDFDVGEFGLSVDQLQNDDKNIRCDFKIILERKPWYYFISSTFSMIVIMIFSLFTFGMSGEGNGAALGIVGSLLLATIAVRFVISQDTPRVPYTTHIDREAIATFFFLLFVAFIHSDFNTVIPSSSETLVSGVSFLVVLLFMISPMIKYSFRKPKKLKET
ncbi:hypothetical protein AN191_10620 [Loktanella sp. 5RATIMAR09]|nr:hypothetical protein AN191_10620 [Loktanella sp. 5RATIMAR09]